MYAIRSYYGPTRKLMVNGNYMKEYWGEGSNRARNWQRYDMGGSENLKFEEGVDSFVPYAGKLKDNFVITSYSIHYTKLYDNTRVDNMSRGLLSIGVTKGAHVGIWAQNVPDWMTFLYACAKIGAVAVTVNSYNFV